VVVVVVVEEEEEEEEEEEYNITGIGYTVYILHIVLILSVPLELKMVNAVLKILPSAESRGLVVQHSMMIFLGI
jgi:hypothetical protein